MGANVGQDEDEEAKMESASKQVAAAREKAKEIEREALVGKNAAVQEQKVAKITALTADASKQFEIQQQALKALLKEQEEVRAKIRIAKENFKAMHPSLAAERENIIEKARAEAMRESTEIKEKAESMAREITHKAHAQAVQATQAALLAAKSERHKAEAALAKAKQVRDITLSEREKQHTVLAKAYDLALQREKIADRYHSLAKKALLDAVADSKSMARKQAQNIQMEESRKAELQAQATRANANRLKLSYLPTLTSYEREVVATAAKAKHDVAVKPIKAIKNAATVKAEAMVGLQSAGAALLNARRKAEVAIKAEQGASRRVTAIEELIQNVQVKLAKADKLPRDKRDDPIQVTKNFAVKEDLESRREDLAIRLEMAKFDYDVRRVQLKKAKACVSLAKRMVDEMTSASTIIGMKSAEQLNRIRQGAEDSFVPVHIAEVAMRLSAKAMEQKLQGIISDSMHLIEHTKEHMLESKKAIAQQIHDIDSQYKHEVKQNRLAMESKVAQTAQRDHLMAEYKMLQEQGRKRDDDINARISEFKGDMEKADALTGASDRRVWFDRRNGDV